MAILQLVKFKCAETIGVLRALSAMALRGAMRGVVLCYMDDQGEEHTMFTGVYRHSPNKAAGASLRMGLTLMQANGEID